MPDSIPIPSESREPLRARLPAACAPSDAALRDLTPKRMVLVRGGEHVSAQGGGFGGSLSADRYFLILLDQGYEETQEKTTNTRTLSLRGHVLEVFPRGDRLDLDVARSVRSRTESTTLRIPLTGDEPSPSFLAMVEQKHANLWRDEFVQIWHSTAPLSVSRDAEDLAYHHASGRINSLADSAAVQAIQQNLGMHNPKPLRELLEKGETSGSKNLLDLEAVHARKSLRYTLMKAVNAVSPEPLLGAQDLSDGRPFSTHQLVAVEAAMGEAFGMKGSFAANEWLTPLQALKESAAIEKTYGMRVGQIAGMHVNIGEVFPSVEFVRGQGMTPTFEVEMTDDDVARNKIFLDARRGGFQAVERQKAEALASVRARTIPVRGMPSQPVSEVFRLSPPAQIGHIGVSPGARPRPDGVRLETKTEVVDILPGIQHPSEIPAYIDRRLREIENSPNWLSREQQDSIGILIASRRDLVRQRRGLVNLKKAHWLGGLTDLTEGYTALSKQTGRAYGAVNTATSSLFAEDIASALENIEERLTNVQARISAPISASIHQGELLSEQANLRRLRSLVKTDAAGTAQFTGNVYGTFGVNVPGTHVVNKASFLQDQLLHGGLVVSRPASQSESRQGIPESRELDSESLLGMWDSSASTRRVSTAGQGLEGNFLSFVTYRYNAERFLRASPLGGQSLLRNITSDLIQGGSYAGETVTADLGMSDLPGTIGESLQDGSVQRSSLQGADSTSLRAVDTYLRVQLTALREKLHALPKTGQDTLRAGLLRSIAETEQKISVSESVVVPGAANPRDPGVRHLSQLNRRREREGQTQPIPGEKNVSSRNLFKARSEQERLKEEIAGIESRLFSSPGNPGLYKLQKQQSTESLIPGVVSVSSSTGPSAASLRGGSLLSTSEFVRPETTAPYLGASEGQAFSTAKGISLVEQEITQLEARRTVLQKSLAALPAVKLPGTIRVGGLEVSLDDIKYLGSSKDASSQVSRERAGAPGEVPVRRIGLEGDVFAVHHVTLHQALKMDDPGFVVYGPAGRQTAAEFLQTFRTSGVDAAGEVFHTWDASLFTRTSQAEGLRSLTLPATLLPGMGKAGTVTVGADFYKSLFRVPLSEYEKDEEKRARMEDTRPRRNGKPYSREEWTPDAGQATRRDLSRAIGRLEDDHPLRPLQAAMEAVPELDSLLRKGRYAPGGFDRFVLHISGDREARNQSVIRTGGIGPLESVEGARIGIREVLRLRSEISQTHLGGASVDPLRLLRDARMMRQTAEAELRTSVYGEKFERATEDGALPTLTEALDWALDKAGRLPPGSHDANDAARLMARKFVESGAWKSRSLKTTVDAQGTFDNAKGEEETFDRLDAGSRSATGPVETDPFLGVQERVVAEQEARAKSPESPGNASYLSVRDFFGRLGSYWNSETKSFTTAPGTSAEVARALEVLSDGENDLLAGNRRAGAFFGYGYDPAKGAQSFRALTAVEYSDPGVRRMTPSAEAFDFLRGLSPNEQGLVARRAGLASSARDRMPMDTSQGAAPGYWKFLEGGERQGWLSGDPYDVKLSGTQFDLLQKVFRPAALDSLILDRDTPQHAQQVDRFLRDPSRPLSPLASTTHLNPPGVTPAMRPVSAGAGQEDLGAVFRIARSQNLRIAAVQDGREEALELLEDDENAVMLNGVLRPLSPGVVHVNADQLAKGVDRAKWRARTDPAELVPLKQLSVPGGKSVVLSPQLSDSPIGSPEVLQRFLTEMQTNGAQGVKVVGYDIESETTLRRDASGKVLLDYRGDALKDTAELYNVGGELYQIGPDGSIMSQRNAFDVASSAFKDEKASDASRAREVARFGETDEQRLISAAYDNLAEHDENTFFMAFNARFDVGVMAEKAKTARDATQKVLAETESREGMENTRLRESLAHFEEAFHFFDTEMPRRTIEASHLFELSGVRRENNTLESFLTAMNVITGPQKHTSLWDVQQMMKGAFQALSGFLGGETPTLEDMAPGQYVFPYNVSGGVVMEKGKPVLNADGSVRRNRSKDPFQLTGIERETLDRDSKVTLFGRNIDEQGNPFGEVREMASFHRGSELQRSLTIGTNYGGLQITGENNEEYWKTSLSDDNLRDIIERNVRRAVGYQGAGKGEADLDRRAEYLARAEIVKGYEATADHEKQGYLHALAADLVPDSSGRYRPRRSEFGMLFRTDGTIDTSTAQEVIPFVNTKTGDRLRTWFMSKETQGDNPGFLVPSTRQSALRTGEILADRPQDQVFQSLIHEAGARGILGAEEVRAAAEGYNSIAESRYPATLREIDGPLSVSVRTVEGGFRAMTRLRSDMSRDAVYDALFEHGLSTSHSVQKAVRNATPEIGPPDNLSTRGAEFSRTMTERILRDLRSAAPEFAGIGTQTRPASLWDLAGEVHSALVQSTRKTLVRDDLDHSMLRLRDGSEETQEGWARQLGRDTRTAIPTSPEDVENFLANPENPRAFARALASAPSLNNGYLATDAYALSMPPMRSSGMNESVLGNLKASGHGLSLPPVAASHIPQAAAGPGETQGLEPPVDSSATLLQRAISEEAGSAAERMVAAAERAGETAGRSRVGVVLGALAALALVGDVGDRMIDVGAARGGAVPPGTPVSTTAHNAGPEDIALQSTESQSYKEGMEGWQKLQVTVDCEHPGFPGSGRRLDQSALDAFSSDISSVLEAHFGNATPTRTSSQDKRHDTGLRWKAASLVRRAVNRHGIPSGAGV